ncbi:hypothetical protein NBRC116588_05950 [Pyruvatibacter sp. HU-CL02332]
MSPSLPFMAELKTKPTKQSVTAFIKTVESERRRTEAKVLMQIMRRVTGKRPVMWGPSIIGYGKYHYVYESGREGDWMVTGFSPRKSAMTVYLMAGFSDKQKLLAKLGKHRTSVSCLYINKLDDIDLDVLEEMITQDVALMRTKYKTA